jgi:hypothetical protein
MKPLTIDAAIEALEGLGHEFYMFSNSESGTSSPHVLHPSARARESGAVSAGPPNPNPNPNPNPGEAE